MKTLFPFVRALCAIATGVLLLKMPDDTLRGMTTGIGVLFLVAGVISCIAWLVGRSIARREERKAEAGAKGAIGTGPYVCETEPVEVSPADTVQPSTEIVVEEAEVVDTTEHEIAVRNEPATVTVTRQRAQEVRTKPHKPMFPIAGIGSILLGLLLALMPTVFVSFLMYVLGAVLVLGALNQLFVLIRAARLLHISWLFYIFPTIVLLTGLYVLLKPMESATLPLIIIGWCLIVYGVVECINTIKVYAAMRRLRKDR